MVKIQQNLQFYLKYKKFLITSLISLEKDT